MRLVLALLFVLAAFACVDAPPTSADAPRRVRPMQPLPVHELPEPVSALCQCGDDATCVDMWIADNWGCNYCVTYQCRGDQFHDCYVCDAGAPNPL